ncbi:MAG: MopE-related protein [archaeon]
MNIYHKIKKEHVFIFLILLTALILFDYFDFGYSGLITKRTCYSEGYSCCNLEEGKGFNHFSLDESCSYGKRCYESCKVEESKNLVTGNAGFIDSIVNFFKNLFGKKEIVSGVGTPECNGKNTLFFISNDYAQGGGHATFSITSTNGFTVPVCSAYMQRVPSGSIKLIGLSENTNAHVQNPYLYNNYPSANVIYVQAIGGNKVIYYQNNNCASGDEILFSISDATNAHVGNTTQFSLKACVNISGTGTPGGGVSSPVITKFYVDNVSLRKVNNPSVNLLENYNFQNSDISKWQIMANPGHSLPNTFERVSNKGLGDSYSLKVQTNDSESGVRYSIGLEPNTQYILSAYIYVENGRIALTFWGDDLYNQNQWVTQYGQNNIWYHLENSITTSSNALGPNGYNDFTFIVYSMLNQTDNPSINYCGNGEINLLEECDSGLHCGTNCECDSGYYPTNPISLNCQANITKFYVDDVRVSPINNPNINLISNSGFESSPLTIWNKYSNPGHVLPDFMGISQERYLNGGSSLKIQTNDVESGGTYPILMNPSTQYIISAWVYVESGRVALTFYGDDRNPQNQWVTPLNVNGWYYLNNSIITGNNLFGPNGYNNSITIYSWSTTDNTIYCGNGNIDPGEQCDEGLHCGTSCQCNSGYQQTNPISVNCQQIIANEFYVDDVSLVDVDNPNVNLLINGGFENGENYWYTYGNPQISGININTNFIRTGTKSYYVKTDSGEYYRGALHYLNNGNLTSNLTQGKTYKLSAYVCVLQGSSALTFWGYDSASTGDWIDINATSNCNSTNWRQLVNYLRPSQGSGKNGAINELDVYSWPTQAFEICNDNIDNDNDNLIDCYDSDCANLNDGIYVINYENDIAKWQCTSDGTRKKELDCDDNIDNDNDGLIDTQDGDCSSLTENCNSLNNNMDNDNAIAALDTDCSFNNYVGLDSITTLGLHSNNLVYKDANLDISCMYRVTDINGTLEPSYLENAYNCIKAKIGINECTKTSRTGNIARFMNCNVGGSIGSQSASCYIDGNCKTTANNLKDQAINIQEYNYCSNYNTANDALIYINELDLGGIYDPGDVLNIELLVYYYINDNKNLRVSASIVDIRNVNEYATVSSNEISTLSGGGYTFDLSLTVPNPSTNGIYKVFIKAYNSEGEGICSQKAYSIGITVPDCIDNDNDDYCSYEDCNDNDIYINPGVTEICSDNIDNNCNNLIDSFDSSCNGNFTSNITCTEGNTQQCSTSLQGICSQGTQLCFNGVYSPCVPIVQVNQMIEQCTDNLDNDCDGLTDCGDSDCSSLSVCTQGPHPEQPTEKDSDNDGMDDAWEIQYFETLEQDGTDDSDKDGINNLQEFKDDTDPTNKSDYLKKKSSKLFLLIAGIIILIGAIAFVVLKFFNKPKQRKLNQMNQPFSRIGSSSTDPRLKSYINDSLRRGFTKDQIRRALKAKGWKDEDIERAFR